MANKSRPECKTCGTKMNSLFKRRLRVEGFVRVENAYMCNKCDVVAKRTGMNNIKYLSETEKKVKKKVKKANEIIQTDYPIKKIEINEELSEVKN